MPDPISLLEIADRGKNLAKRPTQPDPTKPVNAGPEGDVNPGPQKLREVLNFSPV